MQNQDWNIGEKERLGIKQGSEKAVLVGIVLPDIEETIVDEHLDELEFLALTAGAETARRFIQKLDHPNPKTFVGSGKLDEIRKYIEDRDIDLVIFDDDLSGAQQNRIEKVLKVKIVDRSSLILDIFARRAQTAQAKTQVELAQLQYFLPRLRGLWSHLERQRGGIGMRGPGEKEIETDRRIIRDKISLLKKKLEKIDAQNQTQRSRRGQLIRVALVGYTNVGKSSLMNALSKSDVFAEDKLFATLDTTVRKVVLDQTPLLLSDTVGFIRKLPHHLVESFKSTLDEARESDLLLHVVDISHSHYEDQIRTVNKTLTDMGIKDYPTLLIFNKMDAFREEQFDELIDAETAHEIEANIKEQLRNQYDVPCLFISAKTRENLDILRSVLKKRVVELYEERFPYAARKWA
jgi:GTP-binding protein HflX